MSRLSRGKSSPWIRLCLGMLIDETVDKLISSCVLPTVVLVGLSSRQDPKQLPVLNHLTSDRYAYLSSQSNLLKFLYALGTRPTRTATLIWAHSPMVERRYKCICSEVRCQCLAMVFSFPGVVAPVKPSGPHFLYSAMYCRESYTDLAH